MLGLLLERLNGKSKKPDEKSSEEPTASFKSPTDSSSPYNHSNVTSISPAINTAFSQQRFVKIQPVTRAAEDSFRVDVEHKKIRNPSPINSKKLYDDHDIYQTASLKDLERPTSQLITPRFGLDHFDKDSILNNMGSIIESTKEGSFLAQNIPTSTATKVSKFSLEDKALTSRKPFTHNKFGSENLGQVNRQRHDGTIESARSDKGLHKMWQEWWSGKKKNNELLLEASKFNRGDVCKQLLDQSLGEARPDVNYKGENGWTPLHFACLNGNIELVNVFLFEQADIESETSLKHTSLHVAAQKGHANIVQVLVNNGADFNARDIFQNTALHYAAQNDHRDIVVLLLSRPSMDFNIRNNDNKTAYALATSKEVKRLFEMFIAEKNLLSAQSLQKVSTTQDFKSPTAKSAMLEHHNESSNLPNKATSAGLTRKNGHFNSEEERRGFSHKSNTVGETKANSSFNTSSDQMNVSIEEEKAGPHNFKVLGLIGKGSFGEVYLVQKKNTGTHYAMKVLHKSSIHKYNLINYAMTERNVLGISNHPFIVKLHYAFQTPEKLFLILDYCPGGDLGEHLQREKRFSEEKARFYLAEVLLALEDLHKRDIIFRDLKPDNIVIDADGHAKLTDFGLSKEGVLNPSEGARSFCGSVAYLAPEMLRRTGHGKAVDWYLLGVVFYEMLVGVPPYYANNREEMFYNIERAPLKVPTTLSMEARSLLKGLLQRNATRRLGSGRGDAEDIKAHEFFKGIDWDEIAQKKMKPPTFDKKMNVMSKVTYDVFDVDDNGPYETGKINGWSFVAQQKGDQSTEKRLF